MRNRTASLDARLKMSEKNHKRQTVVVIDNQKGVSTKFSTMKEAGIFLNISTTMIGKYLKSNKLFITGGGGYLFNKKRSLITLVKPYFIKEMLYKLGL